MVECTVSSKLGKEGSKVGIASGYVNLAGCSSDAVGGVLERVVIVRE